MNDLFFCDMLEFEVFWYKCIFDEGWFMLNKVDNILFDFFFFSFIRNIVKFVFIVFDGVGFILVFIYFSMFLKVVFEMFRRLM